MRMNLLVEGLLDEAIAVSLLSHTGHETGVTFGKKGWTYIERRVQAFDRACGSDGLLTLVDFMDTKMNCPATILDTWIPNRNPRHLFRVVIREIESWILADRAAIADFLRVPLAKVPTQPELLVDPKLTLINLARTSRSRSIRTGLVPREGYAASEGPLYSSEMTRFVNDHWSAPVAALQSASLSKCIERLRQLHGSEID